jgi:hypothetical protein
VVARAEGLGIAEAEDVALELAGALLVVDLEGNVDDAAHGRSSKERRL